MSTEGYRDNSPPPIEATYNLEVFFKFDERHFKSFTYKNIKDSDRVRFLEKTQESLSKSFEKKNEEMLFIGGAFVNMNHVRYMSFSWVRWSD